jgi:methylated-DNA-protein-cysteine methyltransferase-like protein
MRDLEIRLHEVNALHLEDRAAMSWDAVYGLVKKIPRGRVTTYGYLARKLRLRGGARVAGYAMAGCPSGQGIPWHRVVGAGGRLLISEPHGSMQRKLLESEGVELSGRRIDMRRYAWPDGEKTATTRSRARKRASRATRGLSREN